MLSIRGMVDPPVPYEQECFFIAPIGKEGSELRKRSDGVRDFVVKPAVAELGLETVRADDLEQPGQITLQVIEHVLRAKAVVADLTGANANVFYELAIRHTAKLPVVLIAAHDEIDRLPFDIQQMRVIALDHQDLASAASAKEQITTHLSQALDGAVDSPITTVLNLEALEQGTSVEQTLADLVTRVDDLSRATTELRVQIKRGDSVRETLRSHILSPAVVHSFDRILTGLGVDYEVPSHTEASWEIEMRQPDGRRRAIMIAAPQSVAEAEAVARHVGTLRDQWTAAEQVPGDPSDDGSPEGG